MCVGLKSSEYSFLDYVIDFDVVAGYSLKLQFNVPFPGMKYNNFYLV